MGKNRMIVAVTLCLVMGARMGTPGHAEEPVGTMGSGKGPVNLGGPTAPLKPGRSYTMQFEGDSGVPGVKRHTLAEFRLWRDEQTPGVVFADLGPIRQTEEKAGKVGLEAVPCRFLVDPESGAASIVDEAKLDVDHRKLADYILACVMPRPRDVGRYEIGHDYAVQSSHTGSEVDPKSRTVKREN